MHMRATFKSLPEDPTELRAVSELMAAEIKAQAYQIEKLKKELEEAAYVDGASRLYTLRRVVIPLAIPGLIVVGTAEL
jgi:ABC-type glycerol-3-phosphate transport system permease component